MQRDKRTKAKFWRRKKNLPEEMFFYKMIESMCLMTFQESGKQVKFRSRRNSGHY